MEEIRLGEEELRQDGSLESGSLSISASEAALHMILLDKLSVFRTRYPGVHLRITNETTPQAIERLKQGQSDFAVITAPLLTARGLRQTELVRFREVAVCGPAFSDLATRRCSLSQLARYPLACIGQDSSTYDFYQQFFTSNGLSFRVDIEVATMDQILPVVEHGLGVGFYPEQLVAPRIARGELFCIPLDQPVPERAITLVEDTARRAGHHTGGGHRPPPLHRHEGHPGADLRKRVTAPAAANNPPLPQNGQRGVIRWGFLFDLQFLLTVDAAVFAAGAQLKDLVALLLDGGDAAGVAAADDVHQPAGDGDVGVEVGQHVQVEPGSVPLHLDDVLAARRSLVAAGVLDQRHAGGAVPLDAQQVHQAHGGACLDVVDDDAVLDLVDVQHIHTPSFWALGSGRPSSVMMRAMRT